MSWEIFASAPVSEPSTSGVFYRDVLEVAHAAELIGARGILIYTDHGQPDPWVLAQHVLQHTRIAPLVAVQPTCMHPYTAAKCVASLTELYGRRLYLNLVAGGFTKELEALGDTLPHDQRYARLVDYTRALSAVLESAGSCTRRGPFYTIDGASCLPRIASPELLPGLMISGSSPAGLAAAAALGATAIQYPLPASAESAPALKQLGIRVGIIARSESQQAWELAHRRFPRWREGEILQQLAMRSTDSVWRQRLAGAATTSDAAYSTYWLEPFRTYRGNCPYLIGSYGEVARELAAYARAGYRTIILSEPIDDDYAHAARAIALASTALETSAGREAGAC